MNRPAPKNPYGLENCFDRRALQLPEGRRKAQLFAALIPAGCRTVLDAGGGTGWVTTGLREKCDVVTLDSCAESLSQSSGKTVLGSVDALPFADRSFDLVISSEVFEHLKGDVFDKARSEMMRVAKKCLLVSVPYRESLEARYVRCGFCKHVFHPDYHCRSFTEQDLARLFPEWLVAEWHVFGPLAWGSGVTTLWKLPGKRNIPLATEETVCPQCGKQGLAGIPDAPTTKRTFIERCISFVMRHIVGIFGHGKKPFKGMIVPQEVAPYWIAALFVRNGDDPVIDGDLNRPLSGKAGP